MRREAKVRPLTTPARTRHGLKRPGTAQKIQEIFGRKDIDFVALVEHPNESLALASAECHPGAALGATGCNTTTTGRVNANTRECKSTAACPQLQCDVIV